ncbi:MAG: peptide deformylase [Patescibacteria group bacterium]
MKTAKDQIIYLPDKRLRQRSTRVGLIDKSIQEIIDQMIESTMDWEDSRQHELGVALAAVQIGLTLRIVIIRNDFNNKDDRKFRVFINPEIVKSEGELIADFEGCLSIKNVYGKVPRYPKVKVKATDRDGKPIRITAKGFLARVFQHEIDHTKGTVFIDHIKDNTEAFYRLQDDGHLLPLDYEKEIENNTALWK